MLFNTLHFVVFFPVVCALYFLLPTRLSDVLSEQQQQRFPAWLRWVPNLYPRVLFLLAASYYFYMSWRAEYIFLILGSTLIDYWAGLQMGKYETRRQRRPFLWISLVMNLGVLLTFKYFDFFADSIEAALAQFNILADIPLFPYLLPVGISFYTFQTLSYSVDVYFGRQKPERNFSVFALYVSFFPQLVAGPIERSQNLLPQFRERVKIHIPRIVSGLRLVLWGFFKKMVIADNLAGVVDAVYSNPDQQNALTWLIGTYFFTFQIYCDFSGYSDIAIGTARMLGIDLMKNFNVPYIAKSIREFWARWHISLSTWFRDYVYIPLGGNRVVKWRWYYNLIITFLVSGLWHGANWTYVMWGLIHGLYLVIGILLFGNNGLMRWIRGQHLRSTIYNALSVFFVVNLVALTWVFFRADNVSLAFHIVGDIATNLGDAVAATDSDFIKKALGLKQGYALTVLLGTLAVFYLLDFLKDVPNMVRFFNRSAAFRFAGYVVLLVAVLAFGYIEKTPFIYFQF